VARSGLAGPAAGAAACAATAGLAFDGGGFQPVSWDRFLVVLAATALALIALAGFERPGRHAAAILAALALLTGWAAASWLWSDSPPSAPEEAQRVAVYFAAALVVVVAGRRAPLAWLTGGVAAGVVPVAGWNLALRLAPDWTGRAPLRVDIGSLADPVGYGNALALLGTVGVVLLLGVAIAVPVASVRLVAATLLVPVSADVAVLDSDGALFALGAGLAVLALASGGRPRRVALVLLPLPLIGMVAVARAQEVVSPPPTDVTAAAHSGHRLLLGLALLAAAQAGVVRLVLPLAARHAATRDLSRRGLAVAGLLLASGLVAAAVFALPGHERIHYWRVAVHEAAANPVLGSGAGTYVDWWVRTRDVPLSTREAHSLYLETLAELGPVGLLALVAALGAPLVAALRLRRSAWGPPVLAALAAYDLHAVADFDWELAGVTLPLVVLGASAAVHASPARGLFSTRLRSASLAAVGALTAAGILAFAGNVRLSAAHDAEAAGRFAAAASRARHALRLAPWSAEAWLVVARSRRELGDRAGARAAYRSALARDPNDWQAWAELATVTTGAPRRLALAEAARLNPLAGSLG
jgi:Tetratricopeptide repeat